jgi:DNA-binding transcriptional MerR regulator
MLDHGLGQGANVDAVTDGSLSIGQVARRTGLSVHTLRLYEREGLLAGVVDRDRSGRRLYNSWEVDWLSNCVKFRASGMPLATISRLAQLVRDGGGNETERLELLREHRRHIIEQQAQLQDCLELINAKVASYEQHLADAAPGEPW